MKTRLLLAVLPYVLLTPIDVGAAESGSTSLIVSGDILPGACTISLGGRGVKGTVDFGVIAKSLLHSDRYYRLPPQTIDMYVNCSNGKATVSFQFRDNQSDSRVPGIISSVTEAKKDTYNYGLGIVDGKKVGGYALSFDASTMADDRPVKSIYTANGGRTWARALDLQHADHIFSFGRTTESPPTPLARLSARIIAEPVLNKLDALPLYREVPLRGQTTIEMTYR